MSHDQCVLALGALWLAFAGLGIYVARQKGRGAVEALVLSTLFGPLGVLIAALLPDHPATPVAARNPRIADWRELIDWGGVVTEEDKEQAECNAKQKWATLFGPVPRHVSSDPPYVSWSCPCGRRNRVEAKLGGKYAACAGCEALTIVPTAPSRR